MNAPYQELNAMKSYEGTNFSPEQIRKLAAEFSDEEIRESLGEDDDNRPFLLVQPDGTASCLVWNAYNGPMVWADDDSVRVYAQLDYLRRHGYPSFHSLDEVQAHAQQHSWPRKERADQEPNANQPRG